MIDIHSHILPGVDDGARTLAESVEVVKGLAAQGVTGIIATPHYIDETIYTVQRAENQILIEELRRKLLEAGVGVNLYLGNEIYISPKLKELLRSGVVSPLAGSNYLLVELPMSGWFPGVLDILKDLKRWGYQVILAHPERYTSMQEDFGVVQQIWEAGILLQCNLGSFTGRYGRQAQKTAEKLAKKQMIFALGSDAHRNHGEQVLAAVEKLRKYFNESELRKLLVENPGEIVRV